MRTRHLVWITRVGNRSPLVLLFQSTNIANTGKTRYDNPLKRKYRAKRLAAESESTNFLSSIRSLVLTPFVSCWRRCCSCSKTSCCPDARRISPTEQDSLLTKLAGECFERCIANFILTIPEPSRSTSYSDKEGHCLRRIYGRVKCYCGEGCSSQLQDRWREQDQSA